MPTAPADLATLTQLGQKATAERRLEVFPNHAPAGQMTVTLDCREFTCFCPLTRQPDFATIEIEYVPNQFVVESKSLKLYLETFRAEGVFHEHLAVDIGRDFEKYVQPTRGSVTVKFNVRGGIAIAARYDFGK